MKQPLGLLRDRPDPRDAAYPLAGLLRVHAPPPEAYDFRDREVITPWRQLGNSCVGQAFAHAIQIRAALTGHPIPKPSPLALYAMGRAKDGVAMDADIGTRPRYVAEAARRIGVCADSRWPETPENLVAAPPWDVVRASKVGQVKQYARLSTFGAQLGDDIRHAVAEDHPVVLGCYVDADFEAWRGGAAWDGPRVSVVGGHAMVIVGYRPGAFLVLNSWGPDWGDGGFAWFTERFVASETFDLYVLQTVGEKLA